MMFVIQGTNVRHTARRVEWKWPQRSIATANAMCGRAVTGKATYYIDSEAGEVTCKACRHLLTQQIANLTRLLSIKPTTEAEQCPNQKPV